MDQDEVAAGARVKKDSGSGGCWSRVLMWCSWELGGHVVAGGNGGDGGGS